MATTRKTNNQIACAQLQALKDLKDSGAFIGTMTLDDMIHNLSQATADSRKLNKDLQAKWDSHQYPDSSIVYVQVANDPQVTTCLSCEAQAVLLLLGTNVLQTGLIKITVDTICKLTGLKRTKAKEAIAELKDCGVLAVYRKAARHEAPIYSVDPKVVNVGKRVSTQHKQHMQYVDKGTVHLLKREPEWDIVRKATTMTVQETELDDNGNSVTVPRKYRYMDISTQPHIKSEPTKPDGDSVDSNAGVSGNSLKTHSSTRKKAKQDALANYQCDGQRDLADVLAEMEAAPSLGELPFEV